MGTKTGISWTDSTWNPIRGCSRVSPGCEHCYAEAVAARKNMSAPGKPYEGLTDEKGRWNGKVMRVPKHLMDPIKWQDPRKIFVNSMSDLFHENLPMEDIAQVFAVMAIAERHTFQTLTKRAKRMCEVLKQDDFWTLVAKLCETYVEKIEKVSPGGMMGFDAWIEEIRQHKCLKNVWLGVSAEDQRRLIERVPYLLSTPAGLRWVSAEPLLGPLDFGEPAEIGTWPDHGKFLRNEKEWDDWKYHCAPAIDWVVLGGESGLNARQCELEWLRDAKNHLVKHKVPVWMKQMGRIIAFSGSSSPGEHWPHTFSKDAHTRQAECKLANGSYGWRVYLEDDHGGDPKEWPEDMRVQQMPHVPAVIG